MPPSRIRKQYRKLQEKLILPPERSKFSPYDSTKYIRQNDLIVLYIQHAMVFSSSVFLLLFLPIVIAIYYNPVVKARAFRNAFLLFASLLFYAWGEPIWVFIMLAAITANWALALNINKPKLIIAIVLDLSLLFVFKSEDFCFYLSSLKLYLFFGILFCFSVVNWAKTKYSQFSIIKLCRTLHSIYFMFYERSERRLQSVYLL